MVPSQLAQQQMAAARLVEVLRAYEAGLDALVIAGGDPARWDGLAQQFDEMRQLANALPPVQVTWIELLISRYELAEALWHGRKPGQVTVRLLELQQRHRALLDELSRGCRPYCRAPDGTPHPGRALT